VAKVRRRQLIGALGLILALGACDKVDEDQARLCTGLIAALDDGVPFRVVETRADPDADFAVTIRYVPEAGQAGERWITCRFAGNGLDPGRLDLVSVVTDRDGELSEIKLVLLRRWWLGEFGAGLGDRADAVESAAGRAWAYAAQQTVNAIGLSSVYVLLALAFTLVYGALRRINLAFGDFAMAGAYTGLLGVIGFGVAMGLPLVLVLVLALALTVLSGALWGWTAERAVFRPMRHASGQAALIASVGLAIALQEFVRLVQGADDLWLQPAFTGVNLLGEAGGFTIVVSTTQLVLLGLVACVLAVHFGLIDRGRFGRAWRACSQDLGMAALCGLNVDRTMGATMALATCYAGIAGMIVAIHYGVVSFHMGMILGFKALTGAIVGGLGSPRGAVAGGVVVALTETFWTAYFDIQSKDIAVFVLLALVLIFRPQGLLQPVLRGPDPGLR
jgi:branched-chain amino acid transport system permease protein